MGFFGGGAVAASDNDNDMDNDNVAALRTANTSFSSASPIPQSSDDARGPSRLSSLQGYFASGGGAGGGGLGDGMGGDVERIVSMVPHAAGPGAGVGSGRGGGPGERTVSSGSLFPMTQEELQMKEEEETFYSAKDNKHGDDNIWGLLSGVAGNVYEWYDFAVYGLLASEIGATFFSTSSKKVQLIQSFGVYLAAFVMRPIGAVVFGELGDRIFGRKNALVFSIVLITVPSVLMGCLPAYSTWGVASPISLIILRMMQGLSVGGQLAGSYVISIEQSSASNRGFRGSICDASSVGGFLLASFVTTSVREIFTADQVQAWAWRVPFLLSLVLAPVLYLIVRNAEESKFWAESKDQKETEKIIRENEGCESKRPAIVDLVSSPFRRRQLAGMIGVLSPMSSSYYTLFLWSPMYLSHLREHLSEANAGVINVFVLVLYIISLLVGGKLSDSFPHRMDLMRIGLPGVIVAAPVMYGLYESESTIGYILAQVQYAICLSMVQGGMAAWKVELWMADPTLSYTGVAIGHNVASCLFGGTLPLVATFLYYRGEDIVENSGDEDMLWPRLIPGFYLSALATLSLFCLSFVIRHPHDIRTGEKKMRDAMNKEQRRKRKKASNRTKEGQATFGEYTNKPTYVPPNAG